MHPTTNSYNLKTTIKIILLALSSFGFSALQSQNLYTTDKGKINFFSYTPAENIDATSKSAKAAFNIKSKELVFTVAMKSFEFEKKLMQEHFNEKYVESDKYPLSTFIGKVNENIDFSKDGTYKVTASGKFTCHGVTKDRIMEGTITVKGGKVSINSKFDVVLVDYKIEVPTLVIEKIAETIKITVDAVLEKKKK